MPVSNYYASASRVFALILDDLHVDARRTQVARAAARRLVEQLTPSDLLFVVMTSSSESTGYFTRDRRQAVEMIERFTGQRLPNQTMGRRDFPARISNRNASITTSGSAPRFATSRWHFVRYPADARR